MSANSAVERADEQAFHAADNTSTGPNRQEHRQERQLVHSERGSTCTTGLAPASQSMVCTLLSPLCVCSPVWLLLAL